MEYEREKGLIFCEERLKPAGERTPSPTRPAYESFTSAEKAFERSEMKRLADTPDYFVRGNYKAMKGKEWEALKAHQKRERMAYKEKGKQAFKAVRDQVYREVRQEFRGQWKAFYAAKRSGGDPAELAAMKASLTQAQQKVLDERRDAACEKLRESRDKDYQAVLAQQQVDRDELSAQQTRGNRTYRMFDTIYPAPEPPVRAPAMPRKKSWQPGHTIENSGKVSKWFDRAADHAGSPAAGNERAVPAEVPRNKPKPEQPAVTEMTGAKVEQARVEQAREMTDQSREKQRAEGEAAVRASWNRHRRFGGRRD